MSSIARKIHFQIQKVSFSPNFPEPTLMIMGWKRGQKHTGLTDAILVGENFEQEVNIEITSTLFGKLDKIFDKFLIFTFYTKKSNQYVKYSQAPLNLSLLKEGEDQTIKIPLIVFGEKSTVQKQDQVEIVVSVEYKKRPIVEESEDAEEGDSLNDF